MNLVQNFKENRENLDQFSSNLPYIIHVHDIQNLQLKYVSPNFKKAYQEFVSEDLSLLFQNRLHHVYPTDQIKVKETYLHYISKADQLSSINFLQRMQYGAKPDQTFFTTSILVQDTAELLDLSTPISSADFINKNSLCHVEKMQKFNQLGSKEKQLINLLTQNKSLSEITRTLKITESSVKTYKKKNL